MPISIVKLWSISLLIILIVSSSSFGTQQITQKGVASAPDDSSQINIEQLRQRAIRNAMDLAILQVTGAEISSERSGSLQTRDDTIVNGNQSHGNASQRSHYSSSVRSRVEGHARLVKINKEWREGIQYFVEATFEVDTPEEISQKKNAGYFWRNAGRPSLGLVFINKVNGEVNHSQDDVTRRFFRDNLVKNDLQVSMTPDKAHYLINIHQQYVTKQMVDYGTMTVNCRLSYQIVDQLKNKTLAEYRSFHGPDAGFNIEQARDSCLKAIAPDVSRRLVHAVASIMNDLYVNGMDLYVKIANVPGEFVPTLTDIVNNLYRMSSTSAPSYVGGVYTQKVKYKGNGGELAMAIQDALSLHDRQIGVEKIDERSIWLNWLQTH